MGTAEDMSSDFVLAAKAERDLLAARLAEVQERVDHFEALAAEAREEAKSLADSVRAIEEVAGLAPQLAICAISEELRGERLREVALEVLHAADRLGRSSALPRLVRSPRGVRLSRLGA